MTDNGPTTRLYHAGLRQQKGSVYENGIRVPFLARWPDRLASRKIDALGAHIDVMPTLLAAAEVAIPPGIEFDGINLLPLWNGEVDSLPDRTYFVQSHRGNEPERYRAFAAVEQRYKLVQPLSFSEPAPPTAALELYDLVADPGEERDLADELPEEVERLRAGYDAWFDDVSETRGYHAVRFALGSDEQPLVTLTRQDWRMVTPDGWGRDQSVLGVWEVDCLSEGPYDVTVTLARPAEKAGTAKIAFRGVDHTASLKEGAEHVRFEGISLERGEGAFHASVVIDSETRGVWHVDVARR